LQTYGRNDAVGSTANDDVTIVDGVDVDMDKLDDNDAVELIRPNPFGVAPDVVVVVFVM
jgi:hypothetical protein